MKTPAPATPIDELIDLLQTTALPLDAERVPLAAALGRVLRETIVAPEDQPPFSRSAVDGFAVAPDDCSPRFRIVDFLRAGDCRPRKLGTGEAVRIATGAALPSSNLQVVMLEDAALDGEHVRFARRDGARHVRERAEDARRGDPLLTPPAQLSPGAVALLASLGCTRPLVTRQPRVVHLATGNEIVPPDSALAAGQIRDSNSPLVRAFLAARGIAVKQLRAPEDFSACLASLREPSLGADRADLLLLSGGASVGEHDFARPLLAELGYEILVSRVSARPGQPLLVARRGRSLAFGLPGNPLAHFAALHVFVQTALHRFAGLLPTSPFRTGALGTALESDAAACELLWPAHQTDAHGAPTLAPLRWTSSGDLTSLGRANALIRVPARTRHLAAGQRVQFAPTFSAS